MTERQKRPLPVRVRWHGDGIPMDDLFRADPAAPTATLPPVPAPPGAGEGTEERPERPGLPQRAKRPTPADPAATSGSAADTTAATATAKKTPRAATSTATQSRIAGAMALLAEQSGQTELSERPARRRPPDEPDLVERPGPALPGWLAVLVGLTALGAATALLWRAGPLRSVRLLPWEWGALAGCAVVAVVAFGGLTRGRTGSAWVLTLFGRYRGSVRRTGLVWISPFVLRRRIDVRLRHWRSEPIAAVDAEGAALRVVVLVVWSVRDTARALLAVDDHLDYLREQVEAATARVLSQLPADAFRGDGPSLRDAEAVGDRLTRLLAAECRPVGVSVFSAQPTRIEYAPEVAAAMQRRQIAALDAKHRDTVLTSVIDAVDDTVNRLTTRGLVELDDFERQALVKDLTVAFYTRRGGLSDQSKE
ncbi:SPFH domain-containing protein [Streptomyces laurentii]|uniref:SPFH domain-containing protein n=1 Tax=Streptomyces laurentii TaxID=39478 RepID=UPI003F4CF103